MGKYILVLILVGPMIGGILALAKASSIVEHYDKQAKRFALGGMALYLPTELIKRNREYREKHEYRMRIFYICFLAEIILIYALDRYIYFFGY